MEILAGVFGLFTAIVGFFLKDLHSDSKDTKRRLMALEIEQAVQKQAHNNMSEKLAELGQQLKEMPKGIMEMLSPYFKNLEEKIEAHEKK